MSSHKIDRVLRGALQLWGVRGTVSRDGDAFLVGTDAGIKVRLVRAARGWMLLRDDRLVGEAAGLPGLLRQLRGELAPHAPRGRLIIGSPLP